MMKTVRWLSKPYNTWTSVTDGQTDRHIAVVLYSDKTYLSETVWM